MKLKRCLKYLILFALSVSTTLNNATTSENRPLFNDKLIAGYSTDDGSLSQMFAQPVDHSIARLLQELVRRTQHLPSTLHAQTQAFLQAAIKTSGHAGANDSYAWGTKRQLKSSDNPIDLVNFNSITEPTVYTNDQKENAEAVINALTGSLTPVEVVDFDFLVSKEGGHKADQLKKNIVKKYLSLLRAYTASQSAAVSNLYQIINVRQPMTSKQLQGLSHEIKILFEDEAIKKICGGEKHLSTLKLEEVIATRRILSPKWLINLSQDNPAAMLRGMTQIMAEQLAETYKLRLLLERLLATQSISLLQNNIALRNMLEDSAKVLRENRSN